MMRRGWLLAGILVAQASGAAELSGTVSLSADGQALRSEDAAEAVVDFRPASPPKVAPAPEPFVMGTQKKQFTPRILPITVGSRVRFPNRDPILHNAFSTSTANIFDVGVYGNGDGKTVAFPQAGYVRVFCNVHASMVGHILVLDTPYFTRPDASGRFALKNLPGGSGDLVVWHDRATPWHQKLAAGAKPLAIQLDLTQKRVPPHLNKFGKPYGRASDAGY
jgi:plastocyanin